MLLRRLVLENVGLFRDRNELELTPRIRYRQRHPIILIGGKNGSGKTTLLEALRLGLYGPLALGSRVSGREYEAYLLERIHRAERPLFQPSSAAVGIEFEYAQAGERQTFWVERRWERADGGIRSTLTILQDGRPLDELDRAHADDFLRDLIPPGVSQLFFFDGEKIQQLAETDRDHLALAEATRGLIGLELLERLQSDLRVYAAKSRDGASTEPLQAELASLMQERQSLEERRRELVRQRDESQAREDHILQGLAREEQRLAQSGGSFAHERQALQAEQKQLNHSILEAEGELRDLCEGLLPFMLTSGLCHNLRQQLEAEEQVQRWQMHELQMHSRLRALKERLGETLFPAGEQGQIIPQLRNQLIGRVRDLLDTLAQPPADLPTIVLIHKLSGDDRHRLLSGIDRILHQFPQQLLGIQKRLEQATRRLQDVKAALDKIPADDVLQPLLERLRELQQGLGTAQVAVERADLAVREIDFKLEENKRRAEKTKEKLAEVDKAQGRRALVVKVQSALQDYARTLTTAKIQEVRDAVVRCFTQLWRKGDLVRRIDIDPTDFSVTLFDRQDRPVPKAQLSAGEKQIYAISVLWALAQVSGRPLPMVIDTPLGRLDSDHRGHLVDRYFPQASHQVVILSTDTEIDQAYFRALGASISHAYHLRYDPVEARCVIEKGYFWSGQEAEAIHAAQ